VVSNAQNEGSYYVNKENDTIKQTDAIDYLYQLFKKPTNQEKLKNKKINFSFFPTDSHNSEGRLLVTSFNATFLLGDKSNTNNSTVYFIPYISFNNQFGLELYPTIWLKNNSWNFIGEYFILNYPQNTWGLSGNSPESDETLVDGKQVRVHQSALKGILPNLAIGLGYQFDQHHGLKIEDETVISDNPDYDSQSVQKTISSGLAFPAVYDSRKNIVNPQKGFYTGFTYRYNDPSFGSDDMWQSLFLDIRKYFPIPNSRNILAFRSFYWTIVSGKVPYFDLPATGAEPATGTSSRGIKRNRYRSNALLYFETEYRFNISPNGFFGGVVFSNISSASQYKTQDFEYWKPAAGFGARIKFNKYTKVNVAVDLGFSKDYVGLYLKIGEVF
jgi:outer membrane protein assembly factor BamA